MGMKRTRPSILLLACALGLSQADYALAQYRNLPKAGFQSFSQAAGNNLPSSQGVYLTPGQTRSKANPGEPYDPRHDQLGFVRWQASKMPLHIFISPGLKLPEAPFSELQSTRVDLVRSLLAQKQPLAALERAPCWTDDANNLAAAGIEEWRQFESEGLLSFDFTDDPSLAHILVFWTDGFQDSSEPGSGGSWTNGLTCSQPLPIAKAMELASAGKRIAPVGYVLAGQADIRQNPVVIELNCTSQARLRKAAAHEFGHALGIIKHSPYREDLMFADELVDDLSAGDKATLHALYHTEPQGVF